MENIDLVFLFVLAAFVGYYMCKKESFEGFAAIDDARQAVREVYNADIDAIRNLSTVATKLQAGGLTHPGTFTANSGNHHIPIVAASNGEAHIALRSHNNEGINNYLINRGGHFRLHNHGVGDMFGVNRDGHHYVRHLGDHVMNIDGDGNNPYISLGKTGTWGGKKIYIQNVDAHSDVPTFRVGVHDKGSMMDISQKYGARWARKDGRWTHFDWEDNKNYIRGDTQHDNSLNVGGNLNVGGDLVVNGKRNHYLYYPEDAIIYQNIFEPYRSGIIRKNGNPRWNDTNHVNNKWNGLHILSIGVNEGNPHGARITVPAGKNVIWVRILNHDRWQSFRMFGINGESYGAYAGGYNLLNKYSPDGAGADFHWNVFQWVAMPVPGPGEYILVSGLGNSGNGADGWIAGLAFTSNPWGHAYNSAVAYHWAINGGSAITWNTENWNNHQLAMITAGGAHNLVVPVVPNGKDKLFYIIEHNNNWTGDMHRGIKVNGTSIERLRTTWDHPLARFHNSKIYNRFLAAYIPARLIGNNRHITVTVDMTELNHHIHFREAGTVDFN